MVAELAARHSLRHSGDEDVRDPIGHPADVHDEVAEVIVEALVPVLRRIADLREPNAVAASAR